MLQSKQTKVTVNCPLGDVLDNLLNIGVRSKLEVYAVPREARRRILLKILKTAALCMGVFKQLCDYAALKNSVGGANEIFGVAGIQFAHTKSKFI